jgi:hypothetical protein
MVACRLIFDTITGVDRRALEIGGVVVAVLLLAGCQQHKVECGADRGGIASGEVRMFAGLRDTQNVGGGIVADVGAEGFDQAGVRGKLA